MKTDRGLFAPLCSFENLYRAYRAARRGKRGNPDVAAFEYEQEAERLKLRDEPVAGLARGSAPSSRPSRPTAGAGPVLSLFPIESRQDFLSHRGGQHAVAGEEAAARERAAGGQARGGRRIERLDARGRIAAEAAQAIDEILELLLLVQLQERRALESPEPALTRIAWR